MRRSIIGLAVGCLLPCGCSLLEGTGELLGLSESKIREIDAPKLRTRDVAWNNWSTIEQSNGLITLRHVPAIGGRTMSIEIDGQDNVLVFPEERGKTYLPDSRDNSVHFGGHYTCIGPERIWNVHDQPFNPHAGPYLAQKRTSMPDRHVVRLVSRPDTWKDATIAINRRITVNRGSTHVVIDEQVINRGQKPLEFYVWDFTQIDACKRGRPDRPLKRLTVYLPVPENSENGSKEYTSFFQPPDPDMLAQYDESLPGVLAIHYRAHQFKIASHHTHWWVAIVDHDTGWTYVKAFDPSPDAKFVDGNGPIEVYGANRDSPLGGSFVEMELLTGIGTYPPGQGIRQREHWYVTICKGPVREMTPFGVVCEPLTARLDKDFCDIIGRFGVFHLGSVQPRLLDAAGRTLHTGHPILIDPRREFILSASLPARKDARTIVLDLYDHDAERVGQLARAPVSR